MSVTASLMIDAMVAMLSAPPRRDPVYYVNIHSWWGMLYGRGKYRARAFMQETQRQRRALVATGVSRAEARIRIKRIVRPEDMPRPVIYGDPPGMATLPDALALRALERWK